MIKFFRNVRKRLINEGKTTKYFKYAIGEIILVVIGILIALQINNWNEEQQHNKSRINYTYALIADLEKDSSQLISENKILRTRLLALAKIKQRLASPMANLDTLDHIIRYEYDPTFVLNEPVNRNTFATLSSTGNLEFFPSEIAEAIQNYYQSANYSENYHASQLNFYRNIFTEYLTSVPITQTEEMYPYEIISHENLEEALWQEADLKKAHAIFRGQTALQLNMFIWFERQNKTLLTLNHNLIDQLKMSL